MIGNFSSIETVNENFDKKVQDYVQLDVQKLNGHNPDCKIEFLSTSSKLVSISFVAAIVY